MSCNPGRLFLMHTNQRPRRDALIRTLVRERHFVAGVFGLALTLTLLTIGLIAHLTV